MMNEKYLETSNGVLYKGDCLEVMKDIPDNSIDLILCDLPYGTTSCQWDSIIDIDKLWIQYKRIIKSKSVVVLFGSQPFTSSLVVSNMEWFKYQWVWKKNRATGHVHAKNKPMKLHEDICIFSNGVTLHEGQSINRMPYYPQDLIELPEGTKRRTRNDSGDNAVMSVRKSHKETICSHTNYPTSIIEFSVDVNNGKRFHPTQKPVTLFEYLIKTYTNEGMTVLDNCAGSGTTAVACNNTNRKWICIEQEEKYCEVIKSRVEDKINLTEFFE